ncbi:hypothetical protein HHK36_007981 [Tetracentron sinense]|uniref:Translation initiation factor IF- 2 domain-containing protein n=1 Tax=Tetracentron sinense TaxID=13715 RepID=A0A835DIV4_TETSI|nr:hypothetical protein HHK36_007981 [Tetracentron sinense]
MTKTRWITLKSIPFHLWVPSVFSQIGQICGGLIEIHPDTEEFVDLAAAKIRVHGDVRSIPRLIPLNFHSISYPIKVLIWEDEACNICNASSESMVLRQCHCKEGKAYSVAGSVYDKSSTAIPISSNHSKVAPTRKGNVGTYVHHKEIKAAQGIKISAQGLEHAIAGTGLYVVQPEDDLEDIKEASMQDKRSVMSRIDNSGEGVCVRASTLGSLEAFLELLKSPEMSIPVSDINIGPVHKRDVMRASVMLERKKEYATILAFDVKVTPEARELADEAGVKIFIADTIYHLFSQFKDYIDNLKEEKKKKAAEEVVFPCVLKIMPNCVFNKKDPIVLGVDVLEGIAKIGTPICIPSREFIDIGRIASIEINHKQVDLAKKGQKVALKIASTNAEEQQKMYGRHFEIDDELVSHITRKSIDILKDNYREDLSMEEWRLVAKLKTLFKIQYMFVVPRLQLRSHFLLMILYRPHHLPQRL